MPDRNRLTTLNRIYVYMENLLVRQGTNGNSCDWFELDRAPDLELLRAAAASVCRKHAALQAASPLGRNWGGFAGWHWQRNPAALPDIHYIRVSGACPSHVEDTLVPQNVWTDPLPHDAGPPWRLHVTEYDDVTILQSVTSHVYTCGKSANLISRELLSAYETLWQGGVPDDGEVTVRDRANRRLFMPNWSILRHLQSFAATTLDMAGEMLRRPVRLAGDNSPRLSRGKTRVHFADLGPELWQHLRKVARSENISRHPYYIAAWVETITEFNAARGLPPRHAVKLIDNFSLRPFSDQVLDGFYDICAVPYAIEVRAEPSSRAQREAISAQIEKLRAGKVLDDLTRYGFYHRLIALCPKLLMTKLVMWLVVKSPFIFSNVGWVPQSILDNKALGVQRYFSFPQLFPPGKIMVLITTTPQTVRAVFLWDDMAISDTEMIGEMIPAFRAALARSIEFSEPAQTPHAAE